MESSSSPGPRSGGPTRRRTISPAQKLDHLAAYEAAIGRNRLRKARESAGFEQKDFSSRTSMARATISAAENGHRVPSKANLKL